MRRSAGKGCASPFYLSRNMDLTYGMNKMYILMENSTTGVRDGAGIANIKLTGARVAIHQPIPVHEKPAGSRPVQRKSGKEIPTGPKKEECEVRENNGGRNLGHGWETLTHDQCECDV